MKQVKLKTILKETNLNVDNIHILNNAFRFCIIYVLIYLHIKTMY